MGGSIEAARTGSPHFEERWGLEQRRRYLIYTVRVSPRLPRWLRRHHSLQMVQRLGRLPL